MTVEVPKTLLGRVLAALLTVAVVLALVLMAVLALIVLTLGQSRDNQRHIDCIIASFNPRPPEYCAAVIEHLRDEGVLPTPTTIG